MKILFTICARAGSKGLKNKNISYFLDCPLVNYTLAAYKLFKKRNPNYLIELAINTDSKELIQQVKRTKIKYTHIERTDELAGDTVSKPDVIKDTFIKMGSDFDVVVDLDLTSPLRTIEDIQGVLNTLLKNEKCDVAFSMTTSRRSPYFNQVNKKENGFYKMVVETGFVTRQEAPVVFDMNASIYAYRKVFFAKEGQLKVFSRNTLGYIVEDTVVLDIDNPEDLKLMEIMAKHFYDKNSKYKEIKVKAEELC